MVCLVPQRLRLCAMLWPPLMLRKPPRYVCPASFTGHCPAGFVGHCPVTVFAHCAYIKVYGTCQNIIAAQVAMPSSKCMCKAYACVQITHNLDTKRIVLFELRTAHVNAHMWCPYAVDAMPSIECSVRVCTLAHAYLLQSCRHAAATGVAQ